MRNVPSKTLKDVQKITTTAGKKIHSSKNFTQPSNFNVGQPNEGDGVPISILVRSLFEDQSQHAETHSIERPDGSQARISRTAAPDRETVSVRLSVVRTPRQRHVDTMTRTEMVRIRREDDVVLEKGRRLDHHVRQVFFNGHVAVGKGIAAVLERVLFPRLETNKVM